MNNIVGIASTIYVESLTKRMYNMIVEAYEMLADQMKVTKKKEMPHHLTVIQQDVEELEDLLTEFKNVIDSEYIPLQYKKKFDSVEKALVQWEEGKKKVEEARLHAFGAFANDNIRYFGQ